MLIVKTDVKKYNHISIGKDESYINQSIEEAELMDLKPLLGEQLYNDLVANSTSIKYKELMEGKTYTYNGATYVTKGLIPVLSKFANANYILFSGEIDTPFGMVQKENKYSKHTDFTRKKAMSKQSMQIGYEYFKSVRDFLDRNTDVYEFWKCSTTKRRFNLNKLTI